MLIKGVSKYDESNSRKVVQVHWSFSEKFNQAKRSICNGAQPFLCQNYSNKLSIQINLYWMVQPLYSSDLTSNEFKSHVPPVL